MAEDAIHAFLHDPTSIPEQFACDCVHSERNSTTLSTAAWVGKALLTRHETYIADSECERKALMARIEALETEKRDLESTNATAIEENRNLLDQLESLNGAVADSDVQITNLQSTLQLTQQEIGRLSMLASRTERLEKQIADFEREQAEWHTTLEEKEEDAKSALRRWQDAQRTLTGVQSEMERIEQDAREERERHVEMLGRLERRHAVERELTSAAGRLKGAAALKSAGTDGGGTNVVSHFVKDILQDNANLQMGIVELRDMLQNSNEEVENLRKQLSVHEPTDFSEDPTHPTPPRPHLKEEMRSATAQELHVHHHYHPPAPSTSAKPATFRRPKKKRYGALTAGHFTPPSGASTPRSSISYASPSSAATILQQTAASLPNVVPIPQRWSMSSMPVSSGPSSPHSTHRTSSLFDRVFSDGGHDSSRPTTPETEEPGSPLFIPNQPRAAKHSRSTSTGHKARPSLGSILDVSIENLRQLDQAKMTAAIPEEDELNWEVTSSAPVDEDSNDISPQSDEVQQDQSFGHRPLRRALSHESLLSVSGMDIHTLQSRPSQLLTTAAGRSFTTQAVLSDAFATAARPAALSNPSSSGQSILSGMASEQRQMAGRPGLGRKMGDWMFGRWGATPAPAPGAPAVSTASVTIRPKTDRTVSVGSGSTAASIDGMSSSPRKPKVRTPGINQSGPIPGFGPEVKIQHAPIVNRLDEEALKSLLGS